MHAAAGGTFSIRDLRVFGTSAVAAPQAVAVFAVQRAADGRAATITWTRVPRATSYIVRYGIAPNKLYSSYEVGDVGTVTINVLNRGVPYWFTVDAIGEGGVARGKATKKG